MQKIYLLFKFVGTNGKGSITAFYRKHSLCRIKKILGLLLHLTFLDICERIRVNKEKISKKEFERLLKKIKNNLSNHKLSPFEQIICCALIFFDF